MALFGKKGTGAPAAPASINVDTDNAQEAFDNLKADHTKLRTKFGEVDEFAKDADIIDKNREGLNQIPRSVPRVVAKLQADLSKAAQELVVKLGDAKREAETLGNKWGAQGVNLPSNFQPENLLKPQSENLKEGIVNLETAFQSASDSLQKLAQIESEIAAHFTKG